MSVNKMDDILSNSVRMVYLQFSLRWPGMYDGQDQTVQKYEKSCENKYNKLLEQKY